MNNNFYKNIFFAKKAAQKLRINTREEYQKRYRAEDSRLPCNPKVKS